MIIIKNNAMKNVSYPLQILLIFLLTAGCTGKGSLKKDDSSLSDTLTVPDTGYTGIKQYYSGDRIVKEVTFTNGIRQGEMKSFYQGGQVYQTYWYENGLREDSSKWYYLEGQLFRSTPYVHDTIHGIQKQYYRNGRIRAKLEYIKGLRTPFLEEYTKDGKLYTNYPQIVYTITDNYNTTGRVRINLDLSEKARKVNFYRGEFINGVFDTTKIKLINSVNGKAFVDLRKNGTPQEGQIGIIAKCLTNFGNNYLTYKKIDLPYPDLK
jgi:hypothetical protein